MNILKMTDKEIEDFVDKLWNKKKEKIVEFLKKEIGEISKQDKKEHKSLSDYRVYEELENGKPYKYIGHSNYIDTCYWINHEANKMMFSYGNVYSIDTPNELLEREIKKRQLWFALEKHLKENNCLATNEDWKNEHTDKYYVLYNYKDEEYEVCWGWYNKKNDIFSTNEAILENYMSTLSEEEIKIMFDIN